MRHPPRREMGPESPSLGAEQYRFSNEARKEPQSACWNNRESPRPLSQDERKTAVISGMQNSSVYPQSTRDEAHFHFIGSIAIPCYTSYRTNGLSSTSKLQRFPETPVSSIYEYEFQSSNTRKAPCTPYRPKMRADSLYLTEDVSQLSTSTTRGLLPQH